MKLTEKINKTFATGLLGISLLAGCANYEPSIEVYRRDDGNYLKMEMKDGRVINEISKDYIKIDIKGSMTSIKDSVTYEIDGRKNTIPLYIQKTVTPKGTFTEGRTPAQKLLEHENTIFMMD